MKVKVTQSCPTLFDSMNCSPWNSLGQNTGVASLSLLQGIFATQGSNPGLQLSHKGGPRTLEWVAYPFSRGSSRSRNQTGISCIYIHNGILLSYNKEGNCAICHNWTLKHYDRRNNSEKHKYYDISYMWDLKTKGLIS